jgi:tetratricopeptide (TPR) repeat protein
MEDAGSIDVNYRDLKGNAQQFLEGMQPGTDAEKEQCMMATVIAAAAYYLENDLKSAEKFALKGYEYTSGRSVLFPSSWDVEKWISQKTFQTTKKLTKMKDFIISSNNGGFSSFQKGNKAFLNLAQYQEAMNLYNEAISKGLKEVEWRKASYIRLASCLFKLEKHKEAEKVFLEAWVLHPNIDLTFGDGDTKKFLKSLQEKYDKKYGDLARSPG